METKINQEIRKALKEFDDKYFIDETVNKQRVIQDLYNYDSELISVLLNSDLLKENFTMQIAGTTIFQINNLIELFEADEYWKDSYTKYSNKIGLTSGGKFLDESTEVVLDFPYKDTVLKASMSKENTDKDDLRPEEPFLNEIIAKEEIDVLLDKKVLVNIRRYSEVGESELDSFDDDNLIIKGNNLLALHTIKGRYAKRVKLIYIDPPYNTGSDGFAYNDKFNHTTWLTFMKSRLEIAYDMLSEEGAIYLSIDDSESAYLKVLMDNIFGRENFLAQIAYERSGVSGLGQGGAYLVNTHESIIVFAKNINRHTVYNPNGFVRLEKKDMIRYNRIFNSAGTRIKVNEFIAPSTKENVSIYKHENYSIDTISLRDFKIREDEIRQEFVRNFDSIFRNTSIQKENEFQNKILNFSGEGLYSADYTVSRGKYKGEKITAYYLNGQVFAWLKDSAVIADEDVFKTNKLSQFWTHASIPKADLANEGGVTLNRGKKPENLLKRIIELETEEGDIVLDFFAGSVSTAAAAHKLSRKYIGIEQMEYIHDLVIKRLSNVIAGDSTGISKNVNWKGGGSFVYAELMEKNAGFLKSVISASSMTELQEVFNRMLETADFDFRVDLDEVRNTIWRLPIEDQKRTLIKIIDKNQLYYNYSEINDINVRDLISETDYAFNQSFYAERGE